MLRVDFHCHTCYSRDSLLRPKSLLAACQRKGIDRVVITDHNNIDGALRAQQLEPERVIVGEEIKTQQGELLAFFVKEKISPGLSPKETINQLQKQGAFISVAHPFDRLRAGCWRVSELLEILPLIDAIETFNARCMWPKANQLAQQFAQEHGLMGTVGSDAHVTWELGKASMLLPEFRDAEGLRRVLSQGKLLTAASPLWIHATSRFATWYKKRFRKTIQE